MQSSRSYFYVGLVHVLHYFVHKVLKKYMKAGFDNMASFSEVSYQRPMCSIFCTESFMRFDSTKKGRLALRLCVAGLAFRGMIQARLDTSKMGSIMAIRGRRDFV